MTLGKKIITYTGVAVAASCILTACSQKAPHGGLFPFSLMEKPPRHGAALKRNKCNPIAVSRMSPILQYSPRHSGESGHFEKQKTLLQPGDVIAFYMTQTEARSHLSRGVIQKVPYSLFRFGHLAIIVPQDDQLRLLQVAMKQAVNTEHGLEYLHDKSWAVYRPPSGALDLQRLAEFATIACNKGSSAKDAYDFRATFGISNGNLTPRNSGDIRKQYTCATLVVAALSYAGYDLHALHRGGKLDILTPRQVTDSWGSLSDNYH